MDRNCKLPTFYSCSNCNQLRGHQADQILSHGLRRTGEKGKCRNPSSLSYCGFWPRGRKEGLRGSEVQVLPATLSGPRSKLKLAILPYIGFCGKLVFFSSRKQKWGFWGGFPAGSFQVLSNCKALIFKCTSTSLGFSLWWVERKDM